MQAYHNNQLVGELAVAKGGALKIVEMDAGGAITETLVLPRFRPRSAFVEELELMQRGEGNIRLQFQIPNDAEKFVDTWRAGMTFRWTVAELTTELYEAVFDMESFQPL